MVLVEEMPCGHALLLEFKTIIQCFNNTFKGFGVWDFFLLLFFIRKYFKIRCQPFACGNLELTCSVR